MLDVVSAAKCLEISFLMIQASLDFRHPLQNFGQPLPQSRLGPCKFSFQQFPKFHGRRHLLLVGCSDPRKQQLLVNCLLLLGPLQLSFKVSQRLGGRGLHSLQLLPQNSHLTIVADLRRLQFR